MNMNYYYKTRLMATNSRANAAVGTIYRIANSLYSLSIEPTALTEDHIHVHNTRSVSLSGQNYIAL